MRFIISALALTATSFMLGCTVVTDVKNGSDKEGSFSELKPTMSDLQGTPGAFNGTWQGPCTYTSAGQTSASCSVRVELLQTTSMITASIYYTIGNFTRVAQLKRYNIMSDGSLVNAASGINSGKIGWRGVVMQDSDLIEVSARLMGPQLGLLVTRVPPQFTAASEIPAAISGQLSKMN